MKILTQGRTAMVELPKEIWATSYGTEGRAGVLSSSYISPCLGDYDSIGRAKAVVKELFDYHRNGKNSYIMPEQ
ncbi:MAG: hypothetical protein IJZ85_06425 [Lachnospiraceae bacterium]|nr:hypothetical protein [Lachnospiraceae bacterium]